MGSGNTGQRAWELGGRRVQVVHLWGEGWLPRGSPRAGAREVHGAAFLRTCVNFDLALFLGEVTLGRCKAGGVAWTLLPGPHSQPRLLGGDRPGVYAAFPDYGGGGGIIPVCTSHCVLFPQKDLTVGAPPGEGRFPRGACTPRPV